MQFQIPADIVSDATDLSRTKRTDRLYSPLNQYDLPVAHPVLQFDEESLLRSQTMPKIPETPSRPLLASDVPTPLEMKPEQIQNNPLLDYTTPDLVTLVICDVGILTPSVRVIIPVHRVCTDLFCI